MVLHKAPPSVRKAFEGHEVTWTPMDQARALMDGWGVFETDGQAQIQRYDVLNRFESDAAALLYVETQAIAGLKLHARALLWIDQVAR